MNPATKRILKIAAMTLIAMPLLSALAGLLLGPTVLHPFRRRLTVRQIAQADQAFQGLNATREDFIVRADDGILLGGWKVRPSRSSICCRDPRSRLWHAILAVTRGEKPSVVQIRNQDVIGRAVWSCGYRGVAASFCRA
jgi:hypothetical protein